MDSEGVGVLSKDPVTNLKYHFVVTTAMVTRMCRQYGMELEQAFRLSDFYIQKLDDIHTIDGIKHLHDEMVMDYAEKMRRYNRSNVHSKHINTCKEYIYAHIKERITVEDLADILGVSASYLSRLFKKEMGVSVSAYIRNRKIEMAKNLLRFSNDSMIEIANRLSFFLPEPFYPAVPRGGGDDAQALQGQVLYERAGCRPRPKAGRTQPFGTASGQAELTHGNKRQKPHHRKRTSGRIPRCGFCLEKMMKKKSGSRQRVSRIWLSASSRAAGM